MSLNSFVAYCDNIQDIECVQESLASDALKAEAANTLNKLKLIAKNIMANANNLRNAKIPKQMNDDIQLLIKNCQPRRDYMTKVLPGIIKRENMGISYYRNYDDCGEGQTSQKEKIDKTNPHKTSKSDIDLSIADAKSILRDVKESKEYKRLMSKSYDFSKTIEVPMTMVTSHIKEVQKNLVKFSGLADKAKVYFKNKKDTEVNKLFNTLYNALCAVYSLQLTILKKYTDHSEASIHAIKNNIKESSEKSVDLKQDYTSDRMKNPTNYFDKEIKISEEQYKKIVECDKIICGANNDLSKFNEYKKAYVELCKIAGVPKSSLFIYHKPTGDGKFKYRFVIDKPKVVKLLSNVKLIHTSTDHNLTVLSPRFVSSGGGPVRCWPTPRVYFSIANPITREGIGHASKSQSGRQSKYSMYTPVESITECCVDNEMRAGSAVYVTTTKDIHLKKISYSDL